MPKDEDRQEFAFTEEELREVRLALALRVAALGKVSTGKMMPSERAKLRDRVKTSTRLYDQFRKATRK